MYSPIGNSTSLTPASSISDFRNTPNEQNSIITITSPHGTTIRAKNSPLLNSNVISNSKIPTETKHTNGVYNSASNNSSDKSSSTNFGRSYNKESKAASLENQDILVPLHEIKDFIRITIEDHEEKIMSENFKFKCEMFKEFMLLKQEMNASIQHHSINQSLLEEIAKLKEENRRLKKLF